MNNVLELLNVDDIKGMLQLFLKVEKFSEENFETDVISFDFLCLPIKRNIFLFDNIRADKGK